VTEAAWIAAFAVAGVFLTGASGAARAADHVMVVRSADADEATAEIVTRAWAELNAGGVDATLVQCGPPPGACPPGTGHDGELTLAIASFREQGETITRVDVSVVGRAPSRDKRTVTFAEPAGGAKVIAIRAVELVHAALLEARDAADKPTAVAAVVDREVPSDRRRPSVPASGLSLGVALTTLRPLGGLSSGYGGIARLDWVDGYGFGLSALVGLPMFGATTETAFGRLSTYQTLFALEGTWRFRRRSVVQPYVSAGAGVYVVALKFGEAASDGRRRSDESYPAALLLLGGGVRRMFTERVAAFVDLEVAFASPHPSVELASGANASEADPSLLVSAGVAWDL
jgi:hypothetical protein